LTSTESKLMI